MAKHVLMFIALCWLCACGSLSSPAALTGTPPDQVKTYQEIILFSYLRIDNFLTRNRDDDAKGQIEFAARVMRRLIDSKEFRAEICVGAMAERCREFLYGQEELAILQNRFSRMRPETQNKPPIEREEAVKLAKRLHSYMVVTSSGN